MSKPLTVAEILAENREDYAKIKRLLGNGNVNVGDAKKLELNADARAKAQIEAMIADIIGENVDIEEIKIARYKNIKSTRQGADIAAFDFAINLETWKNNLREEQRDRATKYNLTLKEKE